MSDILTGFNMQGNDPIDDRIVSKSNLETLEQYLNRVPVQKRYYGLTFFALDKNNELRKYTFQTSLIEPTIDDDEEEIERIDKELQEHVSNKAIHKTSEEIRSEIVDADIPDTIARVQWTLDQINTAVINLIGGASDEYNTLKRIQTKIEELRAEMESQLYGDDGGTVLKTLEQALKFLNQYKDFIVDIPDNFVSKQDIVDNLTTDDPTKVLSAKQGKILSDTLTNYFESAMQSIRTETDRAINAENRIEAKLDKEIERSTNEDIRIDNKLDSEINRSTAEDDRLDKKIDAETTRATTAESNLNTKIETETDRAEGEESRIETKLDNEITRSTNKDTEHDNRLQALEGQTHEQNTDLGTTNSTFQLKYNTGNKIKHESDAISVRNAADTDYVNFIAKNATFKGDLLVEGQSFVTEAETVEIKDNLLLLNKGEVGAGVTKGIAGLEIDRGTEPNYQIIFDESDNRFKAGEIGDIQCLALRDGDDSMTGGMFTSWDSTTKRLKTTNIIPESTPLLFGRTDYKRYSGDIVYQENVYSSYSFIDETPQGTLYNSAGESSWNINTTKSNFRFWKPILGTTFKRSSDNSEVLYHADIINDLTTGGTNKVLSAEQGKLLQNSITSIQGSYLPLSGGTMTGSITFPNRKGIFGRLTDGTGNIKIAVVNANNNVEIGNSNIPLMLVSNSTDLTHYRDNNTYKIWDKFNLSDPATLSGNNTFTGNNTFQAGKFNVGPFKVTSSGSLLSNISSPAGSAWSRSLIFRANNDIPSSLVFGGYNSVNNTSIGYVYIGIGDINYQTAQYKFYSNRLEVPNIWALKTGNYNALNINTENNYLGLGSSSLVSYIVSSNSDLRHRRFSATDTYKDYIIWDAYNLPTPASTTDLTNYLPLAGGTLTGQLTIQQNIDIKLRLQSTDTDNYCIIQAIDSQASQLGVFGYAGDKWAIGHNGTYYEIWDKYNLTNPVTYTTNTYNHATLTNKDGQYFTYIKAGTNGLLPHSKATLTSGGSGSLGTSDQGFNAAYINNLHTNKVTFGDAGSFIDNQSGDSSHIGIGFYTSQNAACPVYVGSLCVSDGYANSAPNIPANGIYSKGIIYIENGIGFRNSIWTNDLTPNRNYSGYLQVLDAYDATKAGGPTNDGTVLQINSRIDHWANQLWFGNNDNMYLRRMNYGSTTYGEWNRLLTNKDVNILPASYKNDPNSLPINQIFYAETQGVTGTPTDNGLLFSVQGNDEGIQLWASSSRNGLYYRTKWTSYGNWIKLAATSDLNSYLTKTEASTLYYPYNGRGYLSITSTGRPVMSNNQGYAVKDKDGNEREVLWMGTNNALFLGNTSQYTLNQLDLRCTTLTHNGNKIATQNYVTNQLSNYLPLTGGTLSGNLTINTVGSTTLVINNNDTNGSETFMRVLRKGTASAAIGFRDSLGAYIYNYNSNKYLFIDNDGYARVGTTNGSTRLALITDIPTVSGYLPLSGGTMSGNISFNGGTGHIVVGARETSNYVSAVSFNKGSATNSALIGYHSTGGSDSSGALILVPYSTSANPWAKTIGLYIAKNELLLDGKAIATQEYVNNRSVSWSNITGKPSTYTPSAHSHNSLQIEDNRDVTMLPNNMGPTTLRTFFNANKMPTSDWYSGIHISGWATNYAAWQLCGPSSNNTTTASSLYFRSGKDSTWNSWKKIAFTSDIPTSTSHLTNDSGFITSSALSGYATQSWANGQFAPLKNYFVTSNYASIATTGNEMCIGSLTSGNSVINVNYRNGTGTTSPSTWYWRAGSSTTWANAYWGNLYMNNNLVATQTWSNSQYPLKTGTGASGTWDINISGNASTASAASKLGSTTIGGSAKPIYLSSGTPTACSATVGSATVPVYMNAGTITQCSTTLGVSITGNAATATNATQLGGTAASSYVKANDNISRLTNDSGYTTQEWVNGQGFLTSDSILDKFVPTTGGYIRNSDQVLLRLQRTGFSTGTSRTIEMYFDDSNTDGTSTTPRGSIGYNSEVGMFLYSAKSKKFLAMEYTGRPFYGTPENRYYLLGSNTQYHNLDGYQRIGDIMIQWGYFTVQGNSTRAVNFPVSFTNTVWSVTGSWDNTTTGNQENWGFTDYTSSGFTIINGDGSSRVFHYIAIGPFTRS